MLAPKPEDVLAAYKADKVLAQCDRWEAELETKEKRRVAQFARPIQQTLEAIYELERQIGRIRRKIRTERGKLRSYQRQKLPGKLYHNRHATIDRRRTLRKRFIRLRIEKKFLQEKVLEFRARLKPNRRPYHRLTPKQTPTQTQSNNEQSTEQTGAANCAANQP